MFVCENTLINKQIRAEFPIGSKGTNEGVTSWGQRRVKEADQDPKKHPLWSNLIYTLVQQLETI